MFCIDSLILSFIVIVLASGSTAFIPIGGTKKLHEKIIIPTFTMLILGILSLAVDKIVSDSSTSLSVVGALLLLVGFFSFMEWHTDYLYG